MSYHNLHTSLHYLVKLLYSKIVNYIARNKSATRFVHIFHIIIQILHCESYNKRLF